MLNAIDHQRRDIEDEPQHLDIIQRGPARLCMGIPAACSGRLQNRAQLEPQSRGIDANPGVQR